MNQRVLKVESVLRQITASELAKLSSYSAHITVTDVDVSPDMRNGIIWIGIMAGSADERDNIQKHIEGLRGEIQSAVAAGLKSKRTPRITFKLDTGGEHADKIDRLIKGL
ncbi:MAG TPA: ribosome-binding factor A [Candidatus Dormibacteraeota bacterium]|nr:ribosome-binding factor A [Candidatus Dormibacteraeota bacterium]